MCKASKQRELFRDQSGAVMVFGLLACVLLVGVLWTVIGVGEMTTFRERAQDAADLERTRLLSEVKGQAARLIARATAVVTGKVLTDADQRRLADEALKRIA